MNPRPCGNCRRRAKRLTRGRCPACHTYLCRTGRERPYRGDGRRDRYAALRRHLPPVIANPSCVRCRSSMRRAGYKHGRPYFRCPGCRARALATGPRRPVRQPQFDAACAACRRGLVTAGDRRQYLRCPGCRYLVARSGVKAPRQARGHLASCTGCRRRMAPYARDGAIAYFYCRHCQWAAWASSKRQPAIADARLLPFVEACVPRTLPREIRDEVVTDILLALLKPRRARNGYGLRTSQLDAEVVRRFVRAAWRRRADGFGHLSLDAPTFADGKGKTRHDLVPQFMFEPPDAFITAGVITSDETD